MFTLGQTGLNDLIVLKESDQLTCLRWGHLYLGDWEGRRGNLLSPSFFPCFALVPTFKTLVEKFLLGRLIELTNQFLLTFLTGRKVPC